jgi:hypothetical protein
MSEVRTIGEIDLLTVEALDDLAGDGAEPPCVSVFLPTHRAGPDTRQNPVRLRNLLAEAERTLVDDGVTRNDVDELLAPARELVDDYDFWQYQSDGLAVYLSGGSMRTLRVPLVLDEETVVGARFSWRPILPLLTGDGRFLVLAVSQNRVRLFAGTRYTISELSRGPIPESMAEALALEENEPQLQVRTAGEAGMFHGHGAGEEVDKATVERFLRAVATGLRERVGADRRPLVVAAVGYYLPIFREVSDHPAVVDGGVEGNPDEMSAAQLHEAAWPVVAPAFDAARAAAIDRFRANMGTGRTVTALSEVVVAAVDGQVETLFVDASAPVWGVLDGATRTVERHDERQAGDDDLVDRAAVATVLAGGDVYVVTPPDAERVEPDREGAAPEPDSTVPAAPLAATLRW